MLPASRAENETHAPVNPRRRQIPPKWIYIQSKSDLILRDPDLFNTIWDRLVICITITTDDDQMGRLFEPKAPLNYRRIEVVEKLHDAGFMVEVMIAPVLPLDARRLARRLEPITNCVFLKIQ